MDMLLEAMPLSMGALLVFVTDNSPVTKKQRFKISNNLKSLYPEGPGMLLQKVDDFEDHSSSPHTHTGSPVAHNSILYSLPPLFPPLPPSPPPSPHFLLHLYHSSSIHLL